MILKDTHKGIVQSNYRPTWKFLSNIKDLKLRRLAYKYTSISQQGIGDNTKGPKKQLLEDRAVTVQSLRR